MRLWRNWQTRTFEGRVGNRMGSSPISRTMQKALRKQCFFIYIPRQSSLISPDAVSPYEMMRP